MKHNLQKQKLNRNYPNLFIVCLSVLLMFAQTAAASGSLNLTTADFSIEKLASRNFFSPLAVLVVNTTGEQNDQLPGDGFCDEGAGN